MRPPLQHLMCLQDLIKNLNFERLMEEIKKREEARREAAVVMPVYGLQRRPGLLLSK